MEPSFATPEPSCDRCERSLSQVGHLGGRGGVLLCIDCMSPKQRQLAARSLDMWDKEEKYERLIEDLDRRIFGDSR